LALQTRVLEGDPSLVAAFHQVRVKNDASAGSGELWPELLGQRFALADLMEHNFVPTCSVVLRSAAIPQLPEWLIELPIGDWPLWLLLARSGDFAFLPRAMSVYRVHEAGAWSRLDPRARFAGFIAMFERLRPAGARARGDGRPGRCPTLPCPVPEIQPAVAASSAQVVAADPTLIKARREGLRGGAAAAAGRRTPAI
jgi:hypothetical protein